LGAGFTGLLFSIGKELLARYLVLSSVSSAYGVAGSVVALVVWVYYSSQIFLFGAEFTWVHAQRAKEIAQLKGSTDANVVSE